MFRQLAGVMGANTVLTGYRPSQVAEWLENFWNTGRNNARQAALGPGLSPMHQAMARADVLDPLPQNPPVITDPPLAVPPVVWHHLAYAYMLENTRVVDIFRRVLLEWLTGERLPVPTADTQRWIHCTEQLFFGYSWPYSVRSVTSQLRPDGGAVRRNAYYRLLGMDLNHGTDEGGIYPFIKADIANRDFAAVFEAMLHEVWRGFANRNTAVAANETDDSAIVTLVRRLREMLQSRRLGGTLSREEFDAVAMLSWFHLTIDSDTQIVVDLSARAEGPADRLMRIGERVGLPAHARSDAYFELAEPMSTVLLTIESNPGITATDLYLPGGLLTQDMLAVITHWSVATGRNMKDATARQPISHVLRQLAPGGAANVGQSTAAPSGNGGRVGAYVR